MGRARSRADRRSSKERAASALQHGLPVAAAPPPRPIPDSVSSWSEPSLMASPVQDRRVPIAVKLLMLGLLILGSIYGLTLFRDHKAPAERARPKATLEGERAILSPSPSFGPAVPASAAAPLR